MPSGTGVPPYLKLDAIDDADEGTPTAAENAAKINELLAALRSVGLLRG